MNTRPRAVISGSGMAVPSEILDNEFFAQYLDTSDEWIRSRSGIRQRHRALEHETTGTLAKEASMMALEEAKIAPTDVDLILLATVTPDTVVPAGACWLQAELGASNAPAMDVNAACAGLGYAVVQGGAFIQAEQYRNILVVGAETLSRISNYQDRTSCFLFGDAAAAIVLTPTTDPNRGLIYHHLGVDGRGADYICMPAGGSRMPASAMTVAENLHTLRMKGREVYKFAVQKFHNLVLNTCKEMGITPDDLDLIIPHQSNLRIVNSVQERLGMPPEKFITNIDRYGNTSAASVGLALHEARMAGRTAPGSLVMMIAFGAGLTWAVLLFRM